MALSDAVLSAGTFSLGFLFGKNLPTIWKTLFLVLALSSGLGALYHGTQTFHGPSYWVLVSSLGAASSFLFLAAMFNSTKPQWRWFGNLWPVFIFLGLIIGAFLAHLPFLYLSAVAGASLLLSVLIVPKVPVTGARRWLTLGIASTLGALLLQFLGYGVLFHYALLLGNVCYWLGAKKT